MLLLVLFCVIFSGVSTLNGSYAIEPTVNAADKSKDVCRDFKNRVVPTGRPFYDGCNYCVCGKGGRPRCTKRVCDTQGNSTEENITGSPATDKGVSPNNVSMSTDPAKGVSANNTSLSTDPLPANQTNQQTFGSRPNINPALVSTDDPQNISRLRISLTSDERAGANSNEYNTTQTPLAASSPEQPKTPTNIRPPMDNNEPTFSEQISNILLQTFPVRALLQSPHLDFIRQLLQPTVSKQKDTVEQKPVAQDSGVMQTVDNTSRSNVETSGDITTSVTRSVNTSSGVKPNGESAAPSVPKESGFRGKPKTSWILESSGDVFVDALITTKSPVKQRVRSSADSELANKPMTNKRPVKQGKGELTEDSVTQKHPAKQGLTVSAGDSFTEPMMPGFPVEQVIAGSNETQPFNEKKELYKPTKHTFDVSNSSSSTSGNNLVGEDTPKLPANKIWTMNFEIPRNLFPIFLNYRSHPRLNLRPVNRGSVNSLDSVRDSIMSRLLHNIF